MLAEGRRLTLEGTDVVVAYADSHHRQQTEAGLRDLERIPTKKATYRGASFEEMDTDAVIARRPNVALVDELAHTNVPGGRHVKRWQDVEAMLDAGIDVITTVNVQHLDSLNDAVEALTGVAQGETVPDVVVAAATSVELIDVDPVVLRRRLGSSNVVSSDMANVALSGYFTAENLATLREVALGWLEDHALLDASARAVMSSEGSALRVTGRVVAALTGAPEGEHVLRRAAQIATATRAELIGVHATIPSGSAEREPVWLENQRRLLAELGGRYAEIAANDIATAVLDFAAAEHASQLVLGATRRSRLQELLHGSVINRAIRHAGPVEVHVVPAHPASASVRSTRPPRVGSRQRVPLPLRRRQAAWALAVVAPAAVTLALAPFHASFGVAGALFCALIAVVGVAALGGIAPAALATVVGFLLADFFFTVPVHSLRVDRLIDLIALIAFAAVAGIVGTLVDVLARRGLQSARAQTAAENLARVVADVVVVAPDTLGDLSGTVRRAFDLNAVAVLRPIGPNWQVDSVAGQPVPRRPEEATGTVELSDHRVLAFVATGPSALDTGLLDAFVAQLQHARERYQLKGLRVPDGRTPPVICDQPE
jgi:two-component system sensor histidine kinase KdpD